MKDSWGLRTARYKNICRFASVLLATILGACAQTILTSEQELEESGLRYSLPKTLVKLVITPIGIPATTPVPVIDESALDDAGIGAIRSDICWAGEGFRFSLTRKDNPLMTTSLTSN